jgi:hypothetical protein
VPAFDGHDEEDRRLRERDEDALRLRHVPANPCS